MNSIERLSVQSWSLRGRKTNEAVIAAVKDLGLNGIELCGVHVDFNDPSCFEPVIAQYRTAGIRIVSIGVEGFGPDAAAARKRFEFASQAGCRIISADFAPATLLAALPIVYPLCEEFGIRLAIHNHGGRHWLGNAQTLNWVFAITRDCIGLNMDTAWAMHAHEDPLHWAKHYGEAGRLFAVHLKDFTFDRKGEWQHALIGEGALDLPGLMQELDRQGFAGELIIEHEGDPNDPMPALRHCVKAIRQAAR